MSAEKQNNKSCPTWGKMLKNGFWVVYPLMGVCFLHAFWLMNDRIDQIMYNSVPIIDKKEAWHDIKMPKEGRVEKGLDLALIKAPNEEMLAAGKQMFTTVCSSCHGQDGQAGINNSRNFAAVDGWTNGREFRNMFKTLHHGIVDKGMASYDTFPVATRIGVIHYIRNMIGGYPEITDEDIKVIDDEHKLSVDSVTPHQIPIELAKELLLEESEESNKTLISVVKKVEAMNSVEANSFKSLSSDLLKTVTSLHSSKVWEANVESFMKFVAINMHSNGFKPSVLKMGSKESKELFEFLKGL